jgi:hypothetical protein
VRRKRWLGVPRILWKYILKMRRNPFVDRFITSMIFIFIHSLKYINIFLILYTKCARKCLYVLQCPANQKSLRTTGTSISGFNSDNACYHSVQNLSSSRLSRIVKIKIYKTIILPGVLYGCETWSLILREEHRLRVFEKRALRGICDRSGVKW